MAEGFDTWISSRIICSDPSSFLKENAQFVDL